MAPRESNAGHCLAEKNFIEMLSERTSLTSRSSDMSLTLLLLFCFAEFSYIRSD